MEIVEQIEGYLEYCEKVRRMSPVTVATKRNVLGRFMRITRINSLTELDNRVFEEWMRFERTRSVGAAAVNTYNSVVIALVKYYREMGVKVPLKTALIVRVKEPATTRKFYTAAEIGGVVKIADKTVGLMVRMMFDTGMRIAELVRLKIGCIAGRRVDFVGKGKKHRTVYLSEATAAALCRYVERYLERRGPDDYLWGGAALNGEPPTVNTVRSWLKEAFSRAGLEGFYPHALRHSFATDLQLRGASVMEIKEMLGHESIATTERYLHGFDGRLEELFLRYR